MVGARELLRRLLGKEDVLAISRRYFISNGFDGTLTCIGVVIGAVLSGVPDGLTVVKIGLGAAVGLGTSAVWSVWEIERAETRAEIRRLERAMLTDLNDTRIEHEQRGARLLHAVSSGLGPVVGVLIPLSPFLLAGTALSLTEAAVASVSLGIGILGVFGAYMGSISGQRWYVAAARMALAGLVVAAINVFLPG
ncbi:VIT1/CCC1 transporter family protein [Haloarcula nitratireducens]|uniref:VIT1/CCC1 transporter family protein n=1 Tax=Haloarcula nitratireducens TaxID=2487749 RepID=A0AAW4P9U8_9EURY|nr:VIT1/CCC1 transporter family protein [Halomicroarcula nitratireducens]MBX0294578.1 VIT1/CCC1 transporter family protein [Halomicroarcula nitratireducens]